MNMLLHRRPSQVWGTPGMLSIDGEPEMFTLEDVVRPGKKILHESAIPAGTYRVTIDHSQRFGRQMPHILNVPDFDGIRIHNGSYSGDTSGCVLVGLARIPHGVNRSREAMDRLQPQIAAAMAKGDDVFIEVRNA